MRCGRNVVHALLSSVGVTAEQPPRSWDVVLKDGQPGRLRPLTPSDEPALRAFFSTLSSESFYRRFFSARGRFLDRYIERSVHVIGPDHCQIVAEIGKAIAAVGAYDRLAGEEAVAEVAFAVTDEHQGRGLGTLLLERLASEARHAGIHHFSATVLPYNREMLEVFQHMGFEISSRVSDGLIELSFPIDPTPESERWHELRSRSAGSRDELA